MIKNYKKPFLPLIKALGKRIEKRHFTEPPVFIGGCARSGTTLLLSVLSAHKELFCVPREVSAFSEIGKDKGGNPFPERIDRLYTAFLRYKIQPEANRFCEKTPRNVRSISEIDRFYAGRFRFIHVVRDGRDVVLSRHPKGADGYWVSPERWVNDVAEGLKYVDHPNVYTIKYEDLINDFEPTMKKVCDFIGIPWSEEMESWLENSRVQRNVAYFGRQVKPINNQSIGKWQKPESQDRVNYFLDYPGAKELLEKLGYLG
ncbi:MAG: sulfotransferase family protein [Marinilabiliaceae bacterium]